jgi:hypothetical protein
MIVKSKCFEFDIFSNPYYLVSLDMTREDGHSLGCS